MSKAKEYQSEKAPIFDSQKGTKSTRKLLSHIKDYKVDQTPEVLPDSLRITSCRMRRHPTVKHRI